MIVFDINGIKLEVREEGKKKRKNPCLNILTKMPVFNFFKLFEG